MGLYPISFRIVGMKRDIDWTETFTKRNPRAQIVLWMLKMAMRMCFRETCSFESCYPTISID
jgi:hypothetical protein